MVEPSFEENSLAYDLRVIYAAIVGKRMIAIEESANNKDYPEWYRNMGLLFYKIFSRVDKDRKNILNAKKILNKKCLKVMNEHPKTFLKKNVDPESVAAIERAFNKYQYFLYRVLHNSNQFGSNTDVKGLY